MLINSPNISGSLKVTGNTVITGSLTVLGGINATITGSATSASYVEYTNVANKPTLVSGSAQVSFNGITDKPTLVSGSAQVSFNGITDKPTLVSGSSQITYSGLSGIPSGIVSGSSQVAALGFATTGSNTFQSNQTITGSLFITQNLVVAGSSSIQYVSSSVVDIADNIITVNAFNPGVRFGGLAVADSGSSPRVSGSILFDSIKDQWIFVHENSATTSSVLLMGPETYNDLGNESYISANRLPKGSGIEHLRDSNITDTGTNVSINSNTQVTGSLNVSSTGVFSSNLTTNGKLTVSQASTDFVAEIINTQNATPYGLRIKDAATGANNYPLFSVSNNVGSVEYFRVNSGTGTATFSSTVTSLVNNISADGAGVVLQGYVDNSLRIAVRGSGYNDGARGGLLASTGDFSSSVTATSFEVGNGQFFKARRSSSNLLIDLLGIESGTDNTRLLITGDFNIKNGSLSTLFNMTTAGAVTLGANATGDSNPYSITILRNGTLASPGTWLSTPAIKVEDISGDGPGSLSTTSGLLQLNLGRIADNDTNASNAMFINCINDNGVAFVVTGKRNVGIGTNTGFNSVSGTETTLHISNSNAASLYLTSTAANKYAIYSAAGGNLQVFNVTQNSYPLGITSGGNVLIGTTSDNSTKLNVSGTTFTQILTQSVPLHGVKVLSYGPVTSVNIDLPTEFPLMLLTLGNVWGVFGKYCGFDAGGVEVREFVICRNSGGSWASANYGPQSQTNASLQSVTGSGTTITINVDANSYFVVELTVFVR